MPFIRIFGVVNAFVVENAQQRRELEQHEHVSPLRSSEGGLVQRMLASGFAQDMGLCAGELPTLAHVSQAADNDFGADALPIHSGEIYKMATYVAGGDPREDLGVIVQRWLARRFKPRHEASASERAAATLIGGWHRRGPLTALAWACAGRRTQARAQLASSVPADLHVAYAPAVLLPYIVQCLERMRQLATSSTLSGGLPPEVTAARCLAAPRFAFRTCRADVEVSFADRPLPANTLVILPARRSGASASGARATASDEWTRSPAMRLIQRLLTRVWIESRDVHRPVAGQVASRQPTALHGTAKQPRVQPALVPHELVPHGPVPSQAPSRAGLASFTRTLPFGNALGRQLRHDGEQRRKARAGVADRAELGATVSGADTPATP
jgi:hypothetical protein